MHPAEELPEQQTQNYDCIAKDRPIPPTPISREALNHLFDKPEDADDADDQKLQLFPKRLKGPIPNSYGGLLDSRSSESGVIVENRSFFAPTSKKNFSFGPLARGKSKFRLMENSLYCRVVSAWGAESVGWKKDSQGMVRPLGPNALPRDCGR
jgi:hypothetical protein